MRWRPRVFLSRIVGIPLLIVATLFAVSNRHNATLHFDILGLAFWQNSVELPMYAVILVSVIAGALMGRYFAWGNKRSLKRQARHHAQIAHQLEEELRSMRRHRERIATAASEAPARGS